MKRNPRAAARTQQAHPDEGPLKVRIVGGSMRGRTLRYAGDRRVRPMKDRTREAVFNLVGPRVQGLYAWDLFAGTGAMAFEALSRGAVGATLIERHIPTSKLVRENAESLDVKHLVSIVQADAFYWMRSARLPDAYLAQEPSPAWIVFCCPPYAVYNEFPDKIARLMTDLQQHAPAGSLLVVEAEIPYDVPQLLPGDWQVREYAPAVVGIVPIGSTPSGTLSDC